MSTQFWVLGFLDRHAPGEAGNGPLPADAKLRCRRRPRNDPCKVFLRDSSCEDFRLQGFLAQVNHDTRIADDDLGTDTDTRACGKNG